MTSVLRAGGSLEILATSRQPTRITGEHRWVIQPLGLPSASSIAVERALASPTLRLLVDRARDADRGFRLTADTVESATELCRGTAGIPLAVELAASWIPALGLAEIRQMLGARVTARVGRTSAPARHASLRTAIEWSTALIAHGDRTLLAATSVFNGTFSLADVCAVCAPELDQRLVAAAIARIVDASLLSVERRPAGRVAYRMLVPIREFFVEERVADGSRDRLEERSTAHYLGRAEQLRRDPHVAVVDLASIDDDIDNLRAAFESGLRQGRGDEVARALVPLNGYFQNRYLAWEARRWLTRALESATDPLARAHALRARSAMAHVTNDLDAALEDAAAALRLFHRLRDETGVAMVVIGTSVLRSARGEWAKGTRSAHRGLRLVGPGGSVSARASAASYLGENLAYSGHVREGIASLREAARLFRRSGEPGRAARALAALTVIAVLAGDEAEATRHGPAAVALARQSGSAHRLAHALGAAASVEARWGDPERARQLLSESQPLIGTNDEDVVFGFLFPAMHLLHRQGRTAEVTVVLQRTEALIVGSGMAYPDLWRHAAGGWVRAARSSRRRAPRRAAGVSVAQTTEELTGLVLSLLAA